MAFAASEGVVADDGNGEDDGVDAAVRAVAADMGVSSAAAGALSFWAYEKVEKSGAFSMTFDGFRGVVVDVAAAGYAWLIFTRSNAPLFGGGSSQWRCRSPGGFCFRFILALAASTSGSNLLASSLGITCTASAFGLALFLEDADDEEEADVPALGCPPPKKEKSDVCCLLPVPLLLLMLLRL